MSADASMNARLDDDDMRTLFEARNQNLEIRIAELELSLLPREELGKRAFTLDQMKIAAAELYAACVSEWGDDPQGWLLPNLIRSAVGSVLAVHFSTEDDRNHTKEASIPPVSQIRRRAIIRRSR